MNSIKGKRIFANLALIAGSCVIALLVGEFAVRLLLPALGQETHTVSTTDEVLRPDPVLGHVLLPNPDFGHDSAGFKNNESQEVVDVVALGDSHTYGRMARHSEDISWPRYLKEQQKISVYNMGVWGYGTAQYYELFGRVKAKNPKTILVALFLGNDIFNAYDLVYHQESWKDWRTPELETTALEHEGQDLKAVMIRFQAIRDFLNNKSRLYDILGDRTRVWREKSGLSKPRDVGTHDWSWEDPDVSLIFDERPEQKTLFWLGSRLEGVNLETAHVAEGLRLTKLFLEKMQEETSGTPTTLVVAIIPMKEAVYRQWTQEKAEQNNYLKKTLAFEEAIRQQLLAHCKEKQIRCLDMLPGLSQALANADGVRLYPETWDEHPTAAGYAAYARVIGEYFLKEKLYDP